MLEVEVVTEPGGDWGVSELGMWNEVEMAVVVTDEEGEEGEEAEGGGRGVSRSLQSSGRAMTVPSQSESRQRLSASP